MIMRLSRRYIASVGGAIVVGLFSVSLASAQSMPNTAPLSYSTTDIFAKTLRDQTATADETEWSDFSALAYARSPRSAPAGVQWLPQPLPAVDGINGKIAGFGGGANHTDGFYGTNGSLGQSRQVNAGAGMSARPRKAAVSSSL
jgi:hypothetical protein